MCMYVYLFCMCVSESGYPTMHMEKSQSILHSLVFFWIEFRPPGLCAIALIYWANLLAWILFCYLILFVNISFNIFARKLFDITETVTLRKLGVFIFFILSLFSFIRT